MKLRNAIALILPACWLHADQTRKEVTKSTTATDDSKPNSNQVPEVYAIPGEIKRVLVLRFKFDTDLLAGLEAMVKEHKIRNAVILSAAGSVRNYHLHVVSNRTFPSKNTYIKDNLAPADIIGMNGYIIDGRVHAHVTLATADKAFGGHVEPGTNVFTFAVVTIGLLQDESDLQRVDDKTHR
ncbi:MAG: PPC domain-containing DNA-binding protein [Bryobacteraceae bacterium]